MRVEIRHPEYLGVHIGNAAWRSPRAASGNGWAWAALAIMFGIGVAVGMLA